MALLCHLVLVLQLVAQVELLVMVPLTEAAVMVAQSVAVEQELVVTMALLEVATHVDHVGDISCAVLPLHMEQELQKRKGVRSSFRLARQKPSHSPLFS